ncbi:MAG: 30S ribosomal protein S12 methylthiotransferase RimO [Planctomycetia bacterium]|nr:30S ribosomal protein S12 methylthiotransferase RimO [Planctomycetia bacterium]
MNQLPIVESPASAARLGNQADLVSKGSYSFVSLGCPKNLVDSERMLGLLQLDGYQLVREPVGADFVVINTCGFSERARDESFAAIHEMLELKRRGEIKGVIVSGCLAEREKEKLLETCPEIDHLVGVFGREHVTKVADRLIGGLTEQRTVFEPASSVPLVDRQRLRITPRHFAYLKISEGCDRLCTFCAIPKMRGKHATKPMEEVLREARELAADGVRELNIVAQDTPYYGMDLYGESRLAELLVELEKVDGIEWIRLMYFYPMYVSDALIEVIGRSKKIVPYIDMPLQHINDTMLRRMQRRVNKASTVELISKLHAGIPNLALRTTFITGFPGETEEQVDELVDFIREQKFRHAGVFTYSYEVDTPSAKLPGQIEEDVKNARRDRVMAAQQEVVLNYTKSQVGKRLDVLLDVPVEGERDAWIGRSFADAPDVDGVVFVTGKKLKAGQFVSTEIVASQGYDLIGAAAAKPR